MRRLRNFIVIILALVLIQACAEQHHTPIDPSDELRTNWDEFIVAWEAEDAEKCAQLYLEDGINIPNEAKENKGKEEIKAFYEFLFGMNRSSKYRHKINSVSYTESQATEYGNFEVDWVRNDSTEWTYKARSVTHWTKTDEGDWKIALFLFNKPPEN